MVVLSGMSSREQMADNLSYMALDRYRPLSDREKETVEKAAKAIPAINSERKDIDTP